MMGHELLICGHFIRIAWCIANNAEWVADCVVVFPRGEFKFLNMFNFPGDLHSGQSQTNLFLNSNPFHFYFIASDISYYSKEMRECLNPLSTGTHGCILSTGVTDALVIMHKAITKHSADQRSIVLDQYQTKMFLLLWMPSENKIRLKHSMPGYWRVGVIGQIA